VHSTGKRRIVNSTEMNRAVAIRFIEAFNNGAWDDLPAVVGEDFVLHHPMGGTMRLGPQGMAQVWSHFKAALPDAWHPIPVLIAEGDFVANLLPTYGHFTGEPHQGVPPTGRWLEYGMVNIVRLEGGKLVEGWFGMDPLVELQQMGAVPAQPTRTRTAEEQESLRVFRESAYATGRDYDNLAAFGDVVVAMGPPQHAEGTAVRILEIFRVDDGAASLFKSHEFTTVPPHGGDQLADAAASRRVVTRFIDEVLAGHDLASLAGTASPDILVHPAAMPCEAGYYGLAGVQSWLGASWDAFPDLTIVDYATVAQGDIVAVRWRARGTSTGDFLGLPPTGGTVEYTGVSMYRVEDGGIAEIWDTRNTLGIMLQLNPGLAAQDGHR
jgi:predicted ester cyclase